ncbi:Choline dehydrogenase [Tistlia consotensis]|uniref:Choline dehydrogenase n=1 Tax=Tistlia consotensis USBA 355 TaxID=560819 RepID=A0A1Y6BAF6_9PROT|nr:GMC family oxidoreductase [Tistlia consotensis]SME97762.1 Choline dehydrogenase [Tistlia consotensis USBA 355]SNR57133.1 Choline dehydrogenase [Tistlia consotensis]
MTDSETEILIVGAGVAGALLACGLARKGLKVVLLDAGPRIDRGAAVERFQAAWPKVPECAYPNPDFSPHPTTDKPDGFFVQAGPETFRSTYLKQVGGTTWHWLGTAVRLLPDDFRMRSRFGQGVDWPIGYRELEPWYGAAERELGVSGDDADDLGSPRSTPYPLPRIPQSYVDLSFARALDGSLYPVRATPQARLSQPRGQRPSCCGSASCIPVCPVQAKYDATVHTDLAESLGVTLLPETVATFVELGDDRRVRAVRFRRPGGSAGRIAAKVVVLAANAVETPRLLLSSASESAPAGVANGSDQVGRNLMDHPIQLSWALAREPVWPYRGPGSTSGIESLRAAPWRDRKSALRLEIGNEGWSWPTGAPQSTARRLAEAGLRGDALERALRDETSRHVRLAALTEQLPLPENRITLDPQRRDGAGMRRPVVAYRLDDYTRDGLAEARRVHDEIFAKLGASGVQHATDAQGAGHILGTVRMGGDPRASVVDAGLRAHEHPNLFLVGGGAFPTVGTGNPTLTIAALALRAVEPIAASIAG